ncbi:MAG: hypothetical protein QNJ81_04105 [Acidimicrobiia bacterium]|nr:hypothetical protein [Acidimicrobiia bacterium]
MRPSTRKLWNEYAHHGPDRVHLFAAAGGFTRARTALYPGSYLDVAASVVFPRVTYVDSDRRTPRFFSDTPGVHEIVVGMGGAPGFEYDFLHSDYRDELPLEDGSFDLLVSLYAGFVSEACSRYLAVGGFLLANTSHGDVALASIDRRYELVAVLNRRSAQYRVVTDDLDAYLTPKKPTEITKAMLHARGRGIAYAKSAAAYLFRRTR